MSYWNYRVIQRAVDGETELFVAEVFYNEDNQVTGWSGAADVVGEDLDDLRLELQHMSEALIEPILIEAELPQSPTPLADQADAVPAEILRQMGRGGA
jgi:hypothetical protein